MRNMPARRRDAMNADVRAMKTPAEQALSAAYQAARGNLPGMGAVAALRADAFKQFERVGLPHRRVEEWKYTDLRALMREAYPLAAPPDATAKAHVKAAGDILSGFDCRRLVFVDGAFAPDLSDLKPEPGLTIGSMAEALTKGNALVAQHVGKTFATDDAAVALNTALMGDGVVIRIAPDAEIKRPIHLIFASGSDKPSSIFVRSLIVVEKGAKATIIEDHDSGAAQVNAALELVAGDETQIDYFKFTRARALHVASLLTSVGARAAFGLSRRPAFHHLEPVGARHVGGLAITARAVEMRRRVERLAELPGVAFIKTVEIDLQHLLDCSDLGTHDLPSLVQIAPLGLTRILPLRPPLSACASASLILSIG